MPREHNNPHKNATRAAARAERDAAVVNGGPKQR
jgi:hypothetical protein